MRPGADPPRAAVRPGSAATAGRLAAALLALLLALAVAAGPPLPAGPSGGPPTPLPALDESAIIAFDEAEFVLDGAQAPPGDDADWRTVALPDRWRELWRQERGPVGWYRIRLERPGRGEWSLYLLRYSLNAEVWLNGERIGSGGSMTEPVTRNWNHPLLVELPASGWREGRNDLHIRLYTLAPFGALPPLLVGPDSVLRPIHDERVFLQVTLSEWMFIVTLLIGMQSAAFWLQRREEQMYLWIGGAAAAWTLFSLHLFVRDNPVPAALWWKTVHACIDWWPALLAIFAMRFSGVRQRRVEIAILAIPATATVAYAITPLVYLNVVYNRLHAFSLLVGLGTMLFLGWQAWRQRRSDIAMFAAGMLLIVVLGANDLLLNSAATAEPWRQGFFTLHLGAPAVFVILAWHLNRRFVEALRTARALNESLEARVARARDELEHAFAERRHLEADRAAAIERERIYRDLHDDVGAKLLSLVYASREPRPVELARSALQDLREIVSAPIAGAAPLADLLPRWEDEALQRFGNAGIEATFTANGDCAAVTVDERAVYHLTRVLRELVTNVIQHAGARHADVRIDAEPAGLRIEVHDDGRGLGPDWTPGRGTHNLRQRAAELHGRVTWRARPGPGRGCIACFETPLAAPASPGSGDAAPPPLAG